jgi:hypothetical protein
VQEESEARGAGPGDFALSAAVQLLAGTARRPALALAAEAKLPTATNRVVGSGHADWGASLRVTQRVGRCDVHLNFEHTFTGKPHDAGMRDYSSFAAGLERPLGRFGFVAEIAGHTNLFAHGDDESNLGVHGIVGSESVGENLIFMLGGRWRCTEGALLSLGLSYDEDGSVSVHPSVAVRFR